MIEKIHCKGETLAIIVRKEFNCHAFFTLNDYSQQLGFMSHPVGKQIQPHIHKKFARLITPGNLFIRKGRLQIDFYSKIKNLESRVLGAGGVILLINGGHGFKVLEDLEMFEVKQGPYAGDEDKVNSILSDGL